MLRLLEGRTLSLAALELAGKLPALFGDVRLRPHGCVPGTARWGLSLPASQPWAPRALGQARFAALLGARGLCPQRDPCPPLALPRTQVRCGFSLFASSSTRWALWRAEKRSCSRWHTEACSRCPSTCTTRTRAWPRWAFWSSGEGDADCPALPCLGGPRAPGVLQLLAALVSTEAPSLRRGCGGGSRVFCPGSAAISAVLQASREALLGVARFLRWRQLAHLAETLQSWKISECLVRTLLHPGPGPGPPCAEPAPFPLQLARRNSAAEEYLAQSLPYLQSLQEPLRREAVRFTGLVGRHLLDQHQSKSQDICQVLRGLANDPCESVSSLAIQTGLILQAPRPRSRFSFRQLCSRLQKAWRRRCSSPAGS
ncbi:uncharacterized protein [Anas acuta]|uniref:uncharacterized protein n=1 Tax=Anas acuta TaxID=28680 RepID=UPI0035C88717